MAQNPGLAGVPLNSSPALNPAPSSPQLAPLDAPSLEPTLPLVEAPVVVVEEEAVAVEPAQEVEAVTPCPQDSANCP